jgi:hypothetical protein
MEGSIRLRFPRTSRVVWKVLLLATIFTVASGLFWGNFATAEPLPATFNRTPAEGKPGTVVKVWGEHCELGGKPMEISRVGLYLVAGQPGSPYTVDRTYPVRSDSSWSGEFLIPQTAPSGNYRFSQNCQASDMVTQGGPELDFKVLEGAPPTLTRNPSEGQAGRAISLTGSNCTTPPELGFPQGRALETAKAHLAPKGKETPIATSSEFQVASDGTWKGSITVPSSASSGSYDLWARCWNDSLTLETARVSFQVLGGRNSSPSPPSSTKPEGGVRSTPSSSVEGSPTGGDGETPTATAAGSWTLAQLKDEISSGGFPYWAAVALAVVLLAGGATAAVLVRKRQP